MLFKARIGNWRIHFSMAYVYDVIGINSQLPDGKHILMWDFDKDTPEEVIYHLAVIQQFFNLPKICILNTGKINRHIAYCFKRVTLQKATEIISATAGVCWGFLKWGIIRNKFTLRVTPKCGRKIHLVDILHSNVPEDAKPQELQNWVQYETLHDKFRHSPFDQRVYINGRRGIRRNTGQT